MNSDLLIVASGQYYFALDKNQCVTNGLLSLEKARQMQKKKCETYFASRYLAFGMKFKEKYHR